MLRFALMCLFLLSAIYVSAQSSPQVTTSDSLAISLAQKSIAALTGGASISDVTLNANVISILGSDYETGTGTLRAKGTTQSRVDLKLSKGIRSVVRNVAGNTPTGAWSKGAAAAKPYPGHNCWTDASWFFPALSSLSQTSNPLFTFKYIGQTQRSGISTQHVQVFQAPARLLSVQKLSTIDFYLDPVSFLPISVDFNMHTDADMNTNIPAEINFANYQQVNGIQVPFHIQQMLNGGVILDLTVTNSAVNTALLDSQFTLP